MTEYEQIEPIKLKNIQSDLMYEKSVLKYKKDYRQFQISLHGCLQSKIRQLSDFLSSL